MLYTIGYGGVAWPTFLEALQGAGVQLVVDTRQMPFSKSSPIYCRDELARALESERIGYLQASSLGNPFYKADSLDPYREHLQHHPELLTPVLTLLDQGRCVALLCGCPRPDLCHRGVIAKELRHVRPALEVKHLRPAQGAGQAGPPPKIVGLTLWQPWAWCIAHAGKRIENRTRAPWCPVGTYLAIHAGKHLDKEAVHMLRAHDIAVPASVASMAVVAVARFAGIVPKDCDDFWYSGPVGWLLEDVVAFEPVECKGNRGLWPLPEDVRKVVRERYRGALGR